MLPVISEDIANTAFSEIFEDMPAWRKKNDSLHKGRKS